MTGAPPAGAPPVRRWLVAGSYPPVPGAPAAATVAAVKRAWAAGAEVAVASPRPSAAPHLLASRGAGLARELAALGMRLGCDGVVLCVEPGWPLPGRGRGRGRPGRARLAGRRLAGALSGFARAELVVTGPRAELVPAIGALGPLCAVAGCVTVSGQTLADVVADVAGGTRVQFADPFTGAGLRPGTGAAAPGVGPLEPVSLIPVARGRRLAGRLARALLGRHAPAVRAALGRRRRRGRRGTYG